MRGSLGQAKTALAPQDAGQFLDQMLLGWSLWGVLAHERCHNRLILIGVLPRQDGVAGQNAVPGIGLSPCCRSQPAASVSSLSSPNSPFQFRARRDDRRPKRSTKRSRPMFKRSSTIS